MVPFFDIKYLHVLRTVQPEAEGLFLTLRMGP